MKLIIIIISSQGSVLVGGIINVVMGKNMVLMGFFERGKGAPIFSGFIY